MLGADAYYSTKMNGATAGEAFEKAFPQVINTNASAAFTGSPVIHTITGMFGVAPYIIDMRDDGQLGMKLLPMTAAAPSGMQIPYNFAYTAMHLNPVAAGSMGLVTNHQLEQPWLRTDWKSAFYTFLLSQYLPNLLVKHKDVGSQQYYLHQDKNEANRAYYKDRK